MPFDQICGVAFSTADKAQFVRVVVRTSSAPTIQLRPLKVPDGQSPSVTFEIRESDVTRFKHALKSRGIVGIHARFISLVLTWPTGRTTAHLS